MLDQQRAQAIDHLLGALAHLAACPCSRRAKASKELMHG